MTIDREAGRRPVRDLTSVTQTLAAEFPEVPIGRVLALVVRCVKDLYRIAATRELPAPADDVLDIVTTTVRRRLRISRPTLDAYAVDDCDVVTHVETPAS